MVGRAAKAASREAPAKRFHGQASRQASTSSRQVVEVWKMYDYNSQFSFRAIEVRMTVGPGPSVGPTG